MKTRCERKLFLNDKNNYMNLLTFLPMNKNETKMLGRDDLGRDSFRTNQLHMRTYEPVGHKLKCTC